MKHKQRVPICKLVTYYPQGYIYPPKKYESPISTKTEVEKLKKFAREQKHWNIHILKNGNLIIQYDNHKNEIYIIEIVYKTVIKHKKFI